jgi:hypothetical protein
MTLNMKFLSSHSSSCFVWPRLWQWKMDLEPSHSPEEPGDPDEYRGPIINMTKRMGVVEESAMIEVRSSPRPLVPVLLHTPLLYDLRTPALHG